MLNKKCLAETTTLMPSCTTNDNIMMMIK